ncbi:DMT family transporter [Skermania piniformis]|uniref:DMT family transporter n=1 Tax=Skermania pinensis TaxID=39122 RepID=UPI00082F3A4A|nr:multidrug efflux SMR transporter [Skermania piniformis]
MVWILLVCAIVCEVTATLALRYSDGLTRLLPVVITLVGYTTSFVLLSQVLVRGLAVGVAYAIWSAVGVAIVAIFGVLVLGEMLSWRQVAGLGLVIAGVVLLQSGVQA